MMLYWNTALAQSATQTCRLAQIIPLTGTEPAAKLIIEAPLAEPLASRGVVVSKSMVPPRVSRNRYQSLIDDCASREHSS